ncbi:MAG: ATP-binding protein [Bacteroidetes bacterium]|nr:ATP-binding protein [Bacteroidota bacterium]
MNTLSIILIIVLLLLILIAVLQIISARKQSVSLKNKVKEKEGELQNALAKIRDYEVGIEKQVSQRTLVIKEEYDEKRERDMILKKALKKAEDANFLLNSFLSNVSSEIRTPLNNIIGFASLLEAELSVMENKELFDYAHAVLESGDRLLHLLNNIIDISRVESNDFTLKPIPSALNGIVANTIQVYLFQANKKKLKLNFKPGDIPEGLADETGLSKALSIVLDNSIKFTEQGFINISTDFHKERNLISVRVKDTGVGIDPAFLPELLAAFKTENTGFSKEGKGAGLGLPLAKSLLEMMQGILEIQSEKGVGTTVTLFLRACTAHSLEFAPPPQESKKKARGLHDLDIFIVEDDMMNKLVLTEMTKSLGQVVAAVNGDETLKIIKGKVAENKFFDIMLFDINLPPPWDGVKLMQEIRKTWKQYRSIPFVAQTAYAMAGDREKLLEAGFDDYISKPINQQQLYSIMKNQLNKY